MAVNGIQEAIKQKIVALISGVSGTGNVYDRLKYTSNWQRFLDDFAYINPDTGRREAARGWWVSIPSIEDYEEGKSFDAHWHNFIYPIYAVMAYSDKGDSEPAFNNMIWSVFDLLHEQGVLGLGPANPVLDAQGSPSFVIDGSIDVDMPNIPELRFFGSVLAHYTEFRITVGVAETAHPIP